MINKKAISVLSKPLPDFIKFVFKEFSHIHEWEFRPGGYVDVLGCNPFLAIEFQAFAPEELTEYCSAFGDRIFQYFFDYRFFFCVCRPSGGFGGGSMHSDYLVYFGRLPKASRQHVKERIERGY